MRQKLEKSEKELEEIRSVLKEREASVREHKGAFDAVKLEL